LGLPSLLLSLVCWASSEAAGARQAQEPASAALELVACLGQSLRVVLL
jgi:hypothetical protein